VYVTCGGLGWMDRWVVNGHHRGHHCSSFPSSCKVIRQVFFRHCMYDVRLLSTTRVAVTRARCRPSDNDTNNDDDGDIDNDGKK